MPCSSCADFFVPHFLVQWGALKSSLVRLGRLLTMEDDYNKPLSSGEPGRVELANCEFAWGAAKVGRGLNPKRGAG